MLDKKTIWLNFLVLMVSVLMTGTHLAAEVKNNPDAQMPEQHGSLHNPHNPLVLAAGDGIADDTVALQKALDSGKGRVFLPHGKYLISETLRIPSNSGFYGMGTIIQNDESKNIILVANASNVAIEGIKLTRAEGKMYTSKHGITVQNSDFVTIKNVHIENNRSDMSSIRINDSNHAVIENCTIINYKRIAIDDRTENDLFGYAFHCIDGTGIIIRRCVGTVIRNNRIIEKNLIPNKENQEKYNLGTLTEGRKPSKPGKIAIQQNTFERNYVDNWHQGSAVLISGTTTDFTILNGNYIESCAQGFDLHSDYVIVTDNIINHAMIGIKLTHGTKHLIISNNLLTNIDLWAMYLGPGALSREAAEGKEGKPPVAANLDQGIIIANNIISDFGFGHEYWNWGGRFEDGEGSYAIVLNDGQLEENPPLTDVLISNNIIYDTGRDKVIIDGQLKKVPPRYKYAVYFGQRDNKPQNVLFNNNMFHPGAAGVSNMPIQP